MNTLNGVDHSRQDSMDVTAYSTPLKKLPNSLIDLSKPDHSSFDMNIPISNTTSNNKSIYINEQSISDRLNNGYSSSLKPLNEISADIYGNELLNQMHSSHMHRQQPLEMDDNSRKKQPIYYRPPSSDESRTFDSLLPPKLERRIPLSQKATSTPEESNRMNKSYLSINSKENDDLDSDIDVGGQNHMGEWIDPVVQQALSRQKNNEEEAKKLFLNVLYSLCVKLLVSIWNYISSFIKQIQVPRSFSSYSFSLKEHSSIDLFSTYLSRISKVLYALFALNCIISVLKLTSKTDQCYDLPLTNKQRRLLDLELVSDTQLGEELSNNTGKDSPFSNSLEPKVTATDSYHGRALSKYRKSMSKMQNMFVGYAHGNIGKFVDSSDMSLTKLIADRHKSLEPPHSNEIIMSRRNRDIETNFAKHYDIIFNSIGSIQGET